MSNLFNKPSIPPRRPPGGQTAQEPLLSNGPLFSPTYANIADIQSMIASLQSSIFNLQNQLIQTLDGLSLPVTNNDSTLSTAVSATWPESLGTPPNYVTYNYYNYLLGQNNSAATLITSTYELALKDVGGNDAIDLLPIINILATEIGYINDFVTRNLSKGLNDSSEQRIAELFENLLTSANTQIQNAQNLFQNQGAFLPQSETSLISEGDSQSIQALFKVNLNKLNIQLNQDLHALKTNFASSADIFYSQFLEPALQFRQNVTSQLLPVYEGVTGQLVNSAMDSSNQHLNSILVDQKNRINFVSTQVDMIMNDIINRDAYRNYIVQLSAQGASVPSGQSGQLINSTDSSDALAFFQAAASGTIIADATPSFSSEHNALDDLLNPQAHPQYLLVTEYNAATPSWYHLSATGNEFSTLVGDGSSLTYVVNHNLGTVSVNVDVWQTTGSKNLVIVDTEIVNENMIQISFLYPPVIDGYRVVVIS